MKFSDIVEDEFNSLEQICDVEQYKLTPRAFSMDGVWSFFLILYYLYG